MFFVSFDKELIKLDDFCPPIDHWLFLRYYPKAQKIKGLLNMFGIYDHATIRYGHMVT